MGCRMFLAGEDSQSAASVHGAEPSKKTLSTYRMIVREHRSDEIVFGRVVARYRIERGDKALRYRKKLIRK